MSFSGYYQLLCERGHYSKADCYTHEFCDEMSWCPYCSSPIVWEHLVDTTNNRGQPIELEEIAPQIIDVCDECGHETIVEPARYKIPEKYQCEDCGAWTDDLFRDSWVKIQEQGSDPVYFCWSCYEKRDRQRR